MLALLKIVSISAVLSALISISLTGCSTTDWRTASRDSAAIAPTPVEEPRAVVQVYTARTVSWRKYFGVHSWISFKEKGATEYSVYHVIGWRLRRGLPSVSMEQDLPDRRWFGSEPTLIHDLRGAPAQAAIPKIKAAADSYKYKDAYRVYPGPNSNTFISHIIRNVPELEIELPSTAIGKDWIDDANLFGRSESGTGVQVSLFGLLGATAGLAEGVELNLLGMTFGVDVWRPALKLPFVGRIGFKDAPIFIMSE